MHQEKIWDYFQNEGLGDRKFPVARQRFMVNFLKPGSRVLNIGVGSGMLEKMGLGKGVRMYALDPSERAIDRLRNELDMGERAQSGYAQNIPFSDDFFDAVVMSEVLEHLDDEVLSASLKEVCRVLRYGGFLLASTPFREDLGANRVVCPSCGLAFHKVGHVQSFDKPKMQAIIEKSGLRVERLWLSTFVDWKRKGVKSFLKSVLRVSLARLGEGIADPHILVIARKAAA